MVHYIRFFLKDKYENFEKLRLNFSKCNPSSSLPSATTESRKTVSVLLFSLSKQSSLFFSYHWCEDTFQPSKVGQNSMTELLQARTTSITVRVSSQDLISPLSNHFLITPSCLACTMCIKYEGLPGVLGNKGTLVKYGREQGNVCLFFLGNRGAKLYKCKTNNLVRKFVTRGTKLGKQFWRNNKDSPPGRPSSAHVDQTIPKQVTDVVHKTRTAMECIKYENICYALVSVEAVAKCRLAAFYCTLRGILGASFCYCHEKNGVK